MASKKPARKKRQARKPSFLKVMEEVNSIAMSVKEVIRIATPIAKKIKSSLKRRKGGGDV